MRKITRYNNKLFINFDEKGENFTLDVPHKKDWDSLLYFLRRRGFKISAIPHYVEHYNILSKYHKQATKENLLILLEIDRQSIKVEIGDIRNTFNSKDQFKSTYHDGFIHLNYIDSLRIKNELLQIKKHFTDKGFEYDPCDSELDKVELIIQKEKINSHVHGKGIENIEDISVIVNQYPDNHNNLDANKKRIISGEMKYFYDRRTKRLSCGIAIHNINNMWWVLNNGNRQNIASFDLFDYSPDLPKRNQSRKTQILKEKLSVLEKQRDYRRCEKIYLFMVKKGIEL